MTTLKKRERTQNWTLEEKILLLKLCEGKVDILENKKGDQFSVATKNAAWKEIHTEFVATLGIERDVHRLKEQWQRMKAQARSEMLDFNQRLQQYGDLAKQRQPSEISEEVLKVMRFAQNKRENFPSNSSDSDNDYDDNPLYLCQTEVKQDLDEDNIQIEDSSESFLSSTASNMQNLSRVEFYNKQDFVLNALANLRHRNQMTDFTQALNAAKGNKRKAEALDETISMQTVQVKNKEYDKRSEIIDEQVRTAKLHRETAEIQKKIAQQQLKQTLLPMDSVKDNKNATLTTTFLFAGGNGENRKEQLKKDIWCEIKFCEERIQYHQELLLKHKQRLVELEVRV